MSDPGRPRSTCEDAPVTSPAVLPLSVAVVLLASACADHGEPGVGFARSLRFEVEAGGSVPLGEGVAGRATAFVARTLEEAGGGVARIPGATNVAEGIDFGERSLVGILGGCQPDAAYVLEPIAVVIGNRELGLVGRVVRDEEAIGAEVLSVPYVLLTVDAGDLTVDSPINLQLEGADRCEPPQA
jgi:hypothetical protein